MDVRAIVLGARFLGEITHSVDPLLGKLSTHDSDFIRGITQLKKVYPSPDDVERLFSFTKSPDEELRRDAARAIVELGPMLLQRSDLQEVVARGVFHAMESNDPKVRRTILPALGWFADLNNPECKNAFRCAVNAIADRDEEVCLASFKILEKFGIDRLSSEVQTIAATLKDQEKSSRVRESACWLLRSLERDAIDAIDQLKTCAATDNDERTRRAAALAITRIDPRGDHLDFGAENETLRVGLLDSLREVGPGGRALRRTVEQGPSKNSSTSESDPLLDKRLAGVLPKRQLQLVQYIRENDNCVSFETLRKNIWNGQTPDDTIEKAIHRTNLRLLEEQIPLSLFIKNRRVSFIRTDK